MKKLTIKRETIRFLTSELRLAVGGVRNSGPVDACLPPSPYSTCTSQLYTNCGPDTGGFTVGCDFSVGCGGGA